MNIDDPDVWPDAATWHDDSDREAGAPCAMTLAVLALSALAMLAMVWAFVVALV